MARVTRIYVERLKSYGDYSNRRVGLEAVVDENEDIKEVYMDLAKACETLLDIQDIKARTEEMEYFIKRYEERKKELERLKNEYHEIREELNNELMNLRRDIDKIMELIESKGIRLRDEVIEKLKRIRNALYPWFDP